MNVQRGVEWPGYSGPANKKWDELREELNKLYVGGPAIAFFFDDIAVARAAQTSVANYARLQDSRKHGWTYRTTLRDTTLYAHKVAVKVAK